MSETATRLAQLATLLRDPSPEGRRALLDCVMDLYAVGAQACSDDTRAGFGLLLGDLAKLVDVEARAALAIRLAEMPVVPPDLAGQLARDGIEVAAPLLGTRTVLSPDVLHDVLEMHGYEHAAAIAVRSDLSADLVRRIMALEFASAPQRARVLARLAENPAVEFTRTDYDLLLAHAAHDASLQEALIGRDGLPADIALKLLWHVDPAFGWQALQRALEVDAASLTHAVQVADQCGVPRALPVDHPHDAMAYAETKDRRHELKEPLIVRLLRDRDMASFYACLDLLAGIDRATAEMIVAEAGGHALAVACKAAGFARSTFSTLLRQSDFAGCRGLQQTFGLMNAFEAISGADAQRLMDYWHVIFSDADARDLPSEQAGRKAG